MVQLTDTGSGPATSAIRRSAGCLCVSHVHIVGHSPFNPEALGGTTACPPRPCPAKSSSMMPCRRQPSNISDCRKRGNTLPSCRQSRASARTKKTTLDALLMLRHCSHSLLQASMSWEQTPMVHEMVRAAADSALGSLQQTPIQRLTCMPYAMAAVEPVSERCILQHRSPAPPPHHILLS
jgi:hypothetical protein